VQTSNNLGPWLWRDAIATLRVIMGSWCTCCAPQAQISGGFGAMRCVKVGEFSLLFFSSSLYWVALFRTLFIAPLPGAAAYLFFK